MMNPITATCYILFRKFPENEAICYLLYSGEARKRKPVLPRASVLPRLANEVAGGPAPAQWLSTGNQTETTGPAGGSQQHPQLIWPQTPPSPGNGVVPWGPLDKFSIAADTPEPHECRPQEKKSPPGGGEDPCVGETKREGPIDTHGPSMGVEKP